MLGILLLVAYHKLFKNSILLDPVPSVSAPPSFSPSSISVSITV